MAFAKVRAESAQLERAAEILRTRLRERGVESGQGYEIRLVLDPSLAENAFRLKPGRDRRSRFAGRGARVRALFAGMRVSRKWICAQ